MIPTNQALWLVDAALARKDFTLAAIALHVLLHRQGQSLNVSAPSFDNVSPDILTRCQHLKP